VPLVPGLHLVRLLGRGAHGEVWQGRDLGSGEWVAAKLRRGSWGSGPRPGVAGPGVPQKRRLRQKPKRRGAWPTRWRC
jgi:hypothetical protein